MEFTSRILRQFAKWIQRQPPPTAQSRKRDCAPTFWQQDAADEEEKNRAGLY